MYYHKQLSALLSICQGLLQKEIPFSTSVHSFLYKRTFIYKNVEAEINQNFKNGLRWLPRVFTNTLPIERELQKETRLISLTVRLLQLGHLEES